MSDEDISIGAAVGIAIVITLILSVALTLSVVYISYKVWIIKQKKATNSEGDVQSSAKPTVSAKDSDVYVFPDNLQSARHQSDLLATIQPNPAYPMQQFDAKEDEQVYVNVNSTYY